MKQAMIVTSFTCAFLTAAIVPALGADRHFWIELKTATFSEMETATTELENLGLTVRHMLPPDRLIAKGPESLTANILDMPNVKALQYGEKGQAVEFVSPGATANPMFTKLLQPRTTEQRPELSWADIEGKHQTPRNQPFGKPTAGEGIMTAAENMYTSEYLIGRVAVAVIFMESIATGGSAEDWTPGAEDTVEQKIITGADWLCDQAELNEVNLSWVWEIHLGVPTDYEPIREHTVPYYSPIYPPLSWEFLWIDDALAYLQVGQDEWNGCFALANRLRATYHADWASELFMVMGAKDSDHEFSDGSFSYMRRYDEYYPLDIRHYQSPVTVIAYCGKGIGSGGRDYFLDSYFAHETAHVFGAADEYSGALDCHKDDNCSESFGYLRVPNGNCEYCNANAVECLMKCDFEPLCPYSLAHVGWRDTDGDGPADPIEPHSPLWESLFPVEPGDLLRIYALSGEFVEGISVTDDNMARGTDGTGYTIWDGTNHSGYNVAPGIYMVHNSRLGQRPNITPNPADSTYKPSIVNISMDYVNWVLNWRLERSWSYIRCFLYNAAGQLIDRRIWDKLHDVNRNYNTSLAGVPRADLAKVKFTAWRPDGAIVRTEYSVVPCNCGRTTTSKMWADVSNDVAIGPEDVVRMVNYVYKNQPTAIIPADGATHPNAPYPPGPPPYTCPFKLGDANLDGAVNPEDVVRYKNYVYANQWGAILDNPCGP